MDGQDIYLGKYVKLVMKKGILVASFGTTFENARELNIDTIVNDVKKQYPQIPVYETYTSNMVRKVLRNRNGIYKDSVSEALEKMYQDRITDVVILVTHIIDGIESNQIKDTVKEYCDKFDSVKVSDVLLGTDADYTEVAKVVYKNLSDIVGNDKLVFMGHGTAHNADENYLKLENVLRRETKMDVYVATVKGGMTIQDVIGRIKYKEGSKRVVITPFMLVAGNHAINDMVGDEDSFKTRLEHEGFITECILKGLGEYSQIRDIYLEHLRKLL